jgi:asparagine synthase (glutamine-hydrolysing)
VQIAERAVVVSAQGEALKVSGAGVGTTALCQGVVSEAGRPAIDLADRLRTGEKLERLGAPFAAMLIEGGSATIAADHVGFRHVFGAVKQGWAAVATSARELGEITGAGLDLKALSVFRLAGHYLDSDTAYAGVRKLPAAHFWKLADGRLTAYRYPAEEDEPGKQDPAPAHARRLRDLVAGFLEHHDDVRLELSGGLDSRMVLAAVPPQRRRRLTAFTIVTDGSRDAHVAAELAQRYSMTCEFVNVSGIAELDPAQAHELALAAARRLDGLGRPLSAAVFGWAESQVPQGPRLSGHGGELARALFGAGVEFERPHATVRGEVVDSYIQRWILSNDAVKDEVLSREFALESRALAMRRLRGAFLRERTDWMSALGRFYFRQRMQRWAGITITDGCRTRLTLNPLVDSEVLACTWAVPARQRVGSRYAVRVLGHLDRELARIPLGSGLRPVALDRRLTMTRRLGENTWHGFLSKAGNKVLRTLGAQRRAAAGAGPLGALVVEHWRAHPDLLEPVVQSGLISPDWTERMLAGAVEPDPPTVDFLLNMQVISCRVGYST